MRIPEVKTTHKKVLSLNDIKGVDLTSAPLHVKSTRASYMKNMICKGGVNHKRNGFEQVAHIQDNGKGVKIHSMLSVPNKDKVYINAGAKILLTDSEMADFTECTAFPGAKKMFFNNGLYMFGNNELDKLVEGEKRANSIFDSKGAYVPTTSIGITDELHGGASEAYEGVNLFSTKRVNKLLGAKDRTFKRLDGGTEVWDVANSEAIFRLDGNVDTTKEIKIKATINTCGTLQIENKMPLLCVVDTQMTPLGVSGMVEIEFVKKGDGDGSEYTAHAKMMSSGKEIGYFRDPNNNNETVEIKAKLDNLDGDWTLTFTPALVSPVLGEDNITVEYSVAKKAPIIKEVCELNIGGNTKMLAIVTNDDIVYFSSPSEGYSYFPDNSYVKAQSGVSALIPGNGFLGIASDNEITNVSLTFDTSRDRLLLVPRLLAKISDVGCIAPLSVASLEGDTLFLSKKGIYGLTENGAHLRSSNVNKEILSFNGATLCEAHAAIHNGQYYLFIDGNVYIADARYKTYESQRLDVSYEYEWWRWGNCPSVSAVIHDGEMYLGRGDGRIMKLGKGYSDITEYELIEGELTTADGKEFTFNEELGIKAGDKIKVNECTAKIAQGEFKIDSSTETALFRTTTEQFINLMTKNAIKAGETYLVNETKLYAEENCVDFENNRFVFKCYDGGDGEIVTNADICVELENASFDVKENENGTISLVNAFGELVEFKGFEDVRAILTRINFVEAEMHSAVISLGSGASKSTLHKLIFTPSRETSGEVYVGYETNKADKFKSQVVGSGFDFSALDFYNFSFDADFYRRYEKRLHERNVEFVKFKFKSVSSGDFAIEAFDLIYSENGR